MWFSQQKKQKERMDGSLDQSGKVPTLGVRQHHARATQSPPRLNVPKHLKSASSEGAVTTSLQEGNAHCALPLPSAQRWGISIT